MTRLFEFVPGIDITGLHLPLRHTAQAAGYDLAAAERVCIEPDQLVLVPTGVRIILGADEFLGVYARSSLAIKYRLMLGNGVGIIDADYYGNETNGGHIFVPLINMGLESVCISRGERVAQGIIQKYLLVSEDNVLEQRVGGFGSTDHP